MIYRITVDDINVYGETEDTTLINPHCEIELNSAGSCSFVMPLYHQYYELPQLLTSVVKVYEDDTLIFFGRIIEIKITFNKQKEIYCEGALAYLNDTVQRPVEHGQILLRDFFTELIQNHNDQVSADRRLMVGNITVPDKYVYRKLSYETTWDALNSMCLDTDGGYLFTRIFNGTVYIDWLKGMPYTSDQPVEYALNLIDMTQDINGADICTAVLPIGKYEAEENEVDPPEYLTVEDINGGKDYIENEEAKALYGRILKVKEYNDISNAQTLYDTAALWLADEQYDKLVIECEAAELHYIDGTYQAFRVGQLVRVRSTPHLIDKDLPLTKMSLELDSGVKKITIGTAPRKTLTEITAPASMSTQSSGGSASSDSGGGTTDDPTITIQEIEDDWDTIVANSGTKYDVGNFKLLPSDDAVIGPVRMQKVYGSDNSSNSTWIAMDASKAQRTQLNSADTQYGAHTYWYNSPIRDYLNGTYLEGLPDSLKNGILEVKKYSVSAVGSQNSRNYVTRDKIWIPSYKEFFGNADYGESVGTHYSHFLYSNMLCLHSYGTADNRPLWLRTKANLQRNNTTTNEFLYVGVNYNYSYSKYVYNVGDIQGRNNAYLLVCFCL